MRKGKGESEGGREIKRTRNEKQRKIYIEVGNVLCIFMKLW